MRVKLSIEDRQKLFKKSKWGNTWISISEKLKISNRTLSDWRNGKTTIPASDFNKLIKIAKVKKDEFVLNFLPDQWHIIDAARKGAYKRMELYGDLGTPEGRIKGGINSYKKHKRKPSKFKILKIIKRPKNSESLAEFLGILIGDGHLSYYQVSITTNSKTDKEHALFVKNTAEKLFNIEAKIKNKSKENTINVVISSRSAVKFLNKKGMPIGNKLTNGLSAPSWIVKNRLYQKAFLRGLFDTDGCIYIDTHRTKNKVYKHLGWTITSYSNKLIADILLILKNMGFSPTNRASQKSVYLRKQKEISRYFSEIGSSNPKHIKRYNSLGRVPKRP